VNLPREINMQRTAMTDGMHGGAAHCYRNDKYGVEMMSTRINRESKFTQTWTIDCLPWEEFNTYPELRKAIEKRKEKE